VAKYPEDGTLGPSAGGDNASEELPDTAKVLAATAKDLKSLRDTVVDAASVGAGLWVTYLGVLFYLLIAAGGVTHRDLFFENPVKLPFLGIDLPLRGFFWLGPALFLVLHAYVLLHLVLLAAKVGAFDVELQEQIKGDDIRSRLRRQLPSNIFVQFLAGPREDREGLMGLMLQLIAIVSLIVGPIALLVFFEVKFLPYHHQLITWWHRIALLLDLVLLWTLWPAIARGRFLGDAWRGMNPRIVAEMAIVSIAPLLLVFGAATYPGEWLDGKIPTETVARWHEMLFAGDVNFKTRRLTSLWSNVLVLPDLDLIDRVRFDTSDKINDANETMSLRGRHLEGAVLTNSKLRKADFTAASLQNAQLVDADLRGVKFDCAKVRSNKKSDDCTNLQDAQLSGAQLQEASLERAKLQGADLSQALLQGAELQDAELQGVSLWQAQLQGADLRGARLEGAEIGGANLQGVELDNARLLGANFSTNIQGASVKGAQLQGASLKGAQLQGAMLAGANMEGADLSSAFLWRVEAAEGKDIFLLDATTLAEFPARSLEDLACEDRRELRDSGMHACRWLIGSYEHLVWDITQQIPNGEMQDSGLSRIQRRLNPLQSMVPQEREWKRAWDKLKARSSKADNFKKLHAGQWQRIGCGTRGGTYLIRSLLRRWYRTDNDIQTFVSKETWLPELAKKFLDEKNCEGARVLDEGSKAKLRRLSEGRP
jgi:uncharacterized protein YjbI with pentapeptide repeats